MNKDNAAQYLPLVQALAEGRVIQVDPKAMDGWRDYDERNDGPIDAWHASRIRIKPEPRKAWVWWPPAEHRGEWPSVTLTHIDAQMLVRLNGGHITEVTE